jgi:hypothetical protein
MNFAMDGHSPDDTTIGLKDPTIQVLDCLMGQGKTTWLLDHISAAVVTDQALDLTNLSQRWLVIVPTLKEVDRYVKRFEALGALFYFPNTEVDGRKTWHLQTLVNQGRNIVATHSLFKHLTSSVYRAIERQGLERFCTIRSKSAAMRSGSLTLRPRP